MMFLLHLIVFLCISSTFCDDTSNGNVNSDYVQPVFSFWPQKHFEVKNVRKFWKRDVPLAGQSEGGQIPPQNKNEDTKQQVKPKEEQDSVKSVNSKEMPKVPTETTLPPIAVNDTKVNTTKIEDSGLTDLSKPGVVKRGLIVFGGFTLLAVAYFIFYRTKGHKNDNLNMHNNQDSLQFRYGVLQSNERDNMELSRVPLTMETDDEEDDDLEIFDLEQKKKSLSYVNLKSQDDRELFSIVNDTAIVMDNDDKEQLLLDIDDKDDTLINLSGQHSKSVL